MDGMAISLDAYVGGILILSSWVRARRTPKGSHCTGAVATAPRAVSPDTWTGLRYPVESAEETASKPSD